MTKSNRTHSTRAARALAEASDLSYNQALELVRRSGRAPRPERFSDPEFTAAFLATHRVTRPEVPAGSVAAPVQDPVLVWPRAGKFRLRGGSRGNPGCDDCGELDAVVRVDGRYLCASAAVATGAVWALPEHPEALVAWPPDDTEFLVTIHDGIGYTKDRFGWVDLHSAMRAAIAADPTAQQWTSAGDTGVSERWLGSPEGWKVELNGRPRTLSPDELDELRRVDAEAARYPAGEVIRWAKGRPERVDVDNPVREGAGLDHDWWDPATRYPGLALTSSSGEPVLSCRRCGVVRGKVSETRKCPGRVRVELRGTAEVTRDDDAVRAADGSAAETCDFCAAPAVDCHGGELHFCEAHRPLVLAAFRAGILDRPDYTIADIVEFGRATGVDITDDADEDVCSRCGAGLDDGEGYDGLCGSCADVAETTCSVCDGRFIDDPVGSPGVVVHDPDGLPEPGSGWDDMSSFDLDADHTPHNAY
jgi:hypothetical protein